MNICNFLPVSICINNIKDTIKFVFWNYFYMTLLFFFCGYMTLLLTLHLEENLVETAKGNHSAPH
jgi:hypothetical protein